MRIFPIFFVEPWPQPEEREPIVFHYVMHRVGPQHFLCNTGAIIQGQDVRGRGFTPDLAIADVAERLAHYFRPKLIILTRA